LKSTKLSHLPLYALSALLIAATLWAYSTRIDVAVRARGIVRPEGDALQIVNEVSGRVVQVAIQEGRLVRTGDVLLQLDDRDLRLRERSLLQQIHQTEERLADLEHRLDASAELDETAAEIDHAEEDAAVRSILLNFDNARDRYQRTERLFDAGLASRQSLEEARLVLDRAEAERDRPSTVDLKRAQARNRFSDMAAERIPLRAVLSGAYHDLEQCRLDITRRAITSPIGGRITSMPSLKVGELLNAGSPVASISPAEQAPVVEAWLPTPDRLFVRAGQAVRLQLELVPNTIHQTFDGTVASIAPDAVFNPSGIGGYRVIIRPAPVRFDLELGMTLQVRFVTREERLLLLLFQKIQREFEDDPVPH